jgi:hypothetical protein
MFVVATDFDIPPYSIPNLQGNNSFPEYVDNAEAEILKSLLGHSLYESFVEGLGTDYPDQKWVDLRDGDTYLFCNKTYEWAGMKKMLIPYVYQEWLYDTWDTYTGIGVVSGNSKNAKPVNPKRRIVNAYNMFSDMAGGHCQERNTLYGYLNAIASTGDTFDGTFDSTFGTFKQYLRHNFKDPGTKNIFNL